MYKENAKILTAESKPYNYQGREGVSHKVRFLMDGEIYSVSTTEQLVKEFSQYVGKEGDLTFKLTSPKETLKMVLVSFKPE